MIISAIVLLEDPFPDFPEYLQHMDKFFNNLGVGYEIIVMANGTGNFFRSQLQSIRQCNGKLRAFEFITPVTQAVSIKAVLKEAQGDILVICGSYQQITDKSLERCIKAMNTSVDMVSPWRKRRVDPSINQLQSRVFNWMTRFFVKTKLHDLSCTVKVCRKSVLEEIDLYGNVSRFLPVLVEARGYRVKEVEVDHCQERGKTGIYGFSEYAGRLLDIFTVFFNTRFNRKPLRFFSCIGFGFIGIGLLLLSYLFFERIFLDIPMGDRPLLLGVLSMTLLGVLISGAGLLGEIIAFTNGRHKKEYVIEKTI